MGGWCRAGVHYNSSPEMTFLIILDPPPPLKKKTILVEYVGLFIRGEHFLIDVVDNSVA